MSLTSRLAAAGLMLPDYGGRELGAVLPAALAAVGVADAVEGRDAEADQMRLGLSESSHVIVVMVDGLGDHQLQARKGHAPHLRALGGESLTVGFPSTTATSLSLFGTGQPAGRTGMVGYTGRNERTGGLANLITWEGAYAAQEWQQCPSLLAAAQARGLQVTSFGKTKFAGSSLTQAAMAGGDFVGTALLADRVDGALAACRVPGLTYLYWGEIDSMGHKHGWNSDAWVAALENVDRELGRLARHLPRGVTMVVTADHGMVDVTGAPRWDVATTPALAQEVAFVAGEPRATHVYTDQPAVVAQRWQEVLGDSAVVMVRDEAEEAGLFGAMAEAPRQRIGDVVVAMTGRATVVDTRTQTQASLTLVGVHGSLTPEELVVPLAKVEGS